MTYWRRGARTAGWWAALVIGALVVTPTLAAATTWAFWTRRRPISP